METYFNKDSSLPLYRQLAEELRNRIKNGDIRPGDKLMSESEMVSEYGVGRLTVRNALSLLVNEGALIKVHGKGTFCAEKSARDDALNVEVLLDMNDTYFIPYYVRGISSILSESKSNFLISNTQDDDAVLCSLLEGIVKKGASGVIFQYTGINCGTSWSERILELLDVLSKRNIPVIMLDGSLENAEVSCFCVNEKSGGLRVAEHLSAFGHKKCAFLGLSKHRDSRLRYEGFCEGADIFGLSEPSMIEYGGTWEEDLIRTVNDGVTGIFVFNDDVALKAVLSLKKNGIRVPEDVSVIGFDDAYIATAYDPQLTTLTHPKEKMGRDAANLLLKMISTGNITPVNKEYRPELIMRGSCGRAST